MALHSLAIDRANAIAAWLRSLSVSKPRVFAYGVLFCIFVVVVPNLPGVLGKFIWPLLVAGIVAAVFVYRTKDSK